MCTYFLIQKCLQIRLGLQDNFREVRRIEAYVANEVAAFSTERAGGWCRPSNSKHTQMCNLKRFSTRPSRRGFHIFTGWVVTKVLVMACVGIFAL